MVEKKAEAIMVDFDGSITNYSKREHLRTVDWSAYIDASDTDIPNKPVCEILKKFKDDYLIIILSARSERSRTETEEWLSKYNIHYDYLLLKPDNYEGEDCTFKSEKMDEIVKSYDIFFCIDDRPSCVKALRDKGFYVMQCGEGY